MNVAGPSNSRPRGQSGSEHSVQSNHMHLDHGGDEDQDLNNDDDPVPNSDEDPDQNIGEEDGPAVDTEAALDDIHEKINSCIVVGARKELNAYQKLARRRTFDLEMSEAKGGMVFDYVRHLF